MPVPSLPLELVSLILTELRISCGDDDEALREAGRSISLVCKVWKPLGLGVAWYRLTLDSPAKTRRAARHFRAYPHLLSFTRDFCVSRGENGAEDHDLRVLASPEELPTVADEVVAMWAGCTSLSSLKVSVPGWLEVDRLMFAMPALPHLRQLQHLALVPSVPEDSTLLLAIFLALLPTFTKLRSLHAGLPFAQIRWVAFPPLFPPEQRLPLEDLTLAILELESSAVLNQRTALHVLELVSPATLSRLTIDIAPHDLSILDLLPRFPHLFDLSLGLINPEEHDTSISHAFKVLSRPGQQPFEVLFRAAAGDEDLGECALPCYTTLSSLLSAIPTTFVDLTILDMHIPTDATPTSLSAAAPAVHRRDLVLWAQMPVHVEGGAHYEECSFVKSADGRWFSLECDSEEGSEDESDSEEE
ncbi:hypothetical protein JCM10213_001448 [Rhodosporidiobolus nylandii]